MSNRDIDQRELISNLNDEYDRQTEACNGDGSAVREWLEANGIDREAVDAYALACMMMVMEAGPMSVKPMVIRAFRCGWDMCSKLNAPIDLDAVFSEDESEDESPGELPA